MEDSPKKKEWKKFIEDVIDKSMKKYKVPTGYSTCQECGTIYPDELGCPRCKGKEKKEYEERIEEDKKSEDSGEGNSGEEDRKSEDSGEGKSGEDEEDDIFP